MVPYVSKTECVYYSIDIMLSTSNTIAGYSQNTEAVVFHKEDEMHAIMVDDAGYVVTHYDQCHMNLHQKYACR
ncbi:MAG: hypothetical protein ACP5RP_00560 [Candidatus Micrarchaeia archaeon]